MAADSIPVFTELFSVDGIRLPDAAVFGAVWFYSWQDKKHCDKAPATLAKELGIGANTVRRSIAKLQELGLIKDTTPDVKNRAHKLRLTEKGKALLPDRLPKMGNQKQVTSEPEVTQSGQPRVPKMGNQEPIRVPKMGNDKNTTKKLKKTTKAPTPPAVKVYQQQIHKYPPKTWWSEIVKAVGDKPADLERWGEVLHAYVGCGWNPVNVKTQLEFYGRGEIPGANKNGAKPHETHSSGSRLDEQPTFDPYTRRTVPAKN